MYALFYGGQSGIRTLERVLAVTRFPIVRLRPAQPTVHFRNITDTLRIDLIIISQQKQFVKHFFKKNCFFSGNSDIRAQFFKYSVAYTIYLL